MEPRSLHRAKPRLAGSFFPFVSVQGKLVFKGDLPLSNPLVVKVTIHLADMVIPGPEIFLLDNGSFRKGLISALPVPRALLSGT